MEGLEKIHKQVMERKESREIVNRMKFTLSRHCDKISNEVSNIGNRISGTQTAIEKNSIAVNQELIAFKKAAAEEMRMEDMDNHIKNSFEEKAEFIENCSSEIEQLKMDMAHNQKKQAAKRIEVKENLLKLKDVSKEMARITGVCWDYKNCDAHQLKGYVVSKIHTRIKPFTISLGNKSSEEIALNVWSLVEEVNSK